MDLEDEILPHPQVTQDYDQYTHSEDSFFSSFFSKYVYKFRHFLITFLFIQYALYVFLALKIETSNVPASILKESNPIQKAFNWANYELW